MSFAILPIVAKNTSDIQQLRLHNQLLSQPLKGNPEDVVKHLVVIQAQDYFGAMWAIGLRLKRAVESDVEKAFTQGRILRTHVMRPTWHFVASEDIRWLLKLTAPRVHGQNAGMYRQNQLDVKIFSRAHVVIGKALAGKTLTRNELKAELDRAKIPTTNLRMAYIMMHAELEGLICSGPRRGKQFTYALLDERSPASKPLDRDETLAQFMLRFINGRGPATAQDFAYWSRLTVADANIALEMVKASLIQEDQYWHSKESRAPKKSSGIAYLLPNYDEFVMSYKDHGLSLEREQKAQLLDYSFSHLIIIDGKLIGTWRRGQRQNEVEVELWPFKKLSPTEKRQIRIAAERYQDFLQRPIRVIN